MDESHVGIPDSTEAAAGDTNPQRRVQTDGRAAQRRTIRFVAAALSALTAFVYLLIGLRVLTVLDTPSDQIFGYFACAGYALGVFLLLRYDRRLVVILGALFQVFVIYQYFNLSTQRAPAFEIWGLLLRIPQVMILVALVYLEVRLPLARATAPDARLARQN